MAESEQSTEGKALLEPQRRLEVEVNVVALSTADQVKKAAESGHYD